MGNKNSTSLFQDSKGFLWVGSFKGLSRFDGKRFDNYGLNEGLPGLSVHQVCEDTMGFIYIATTSGIARYTGKRNAGTDTCFHIYTETVGLDAPIMGMQAIDSNTIIFQKTDKGVFLLRNKEVKPLWENTPAYMINIFKDRNNYYYAYKKDTFRVYDKNLKHVKTVFFPDSEFTTSYMDSEGDLQLYYKGKKYRLDPVKGLTDSVSVPDSFWWFCSFKGENKLFYSNSSGIFLYNNGVNTKMIDLVKLKIFSNGYTQAVDGSVWMSSAGHGVFKAVPLPYYEIDPDVTGVLVRNNRGKMILNTDNPLMRKAEIARAGRELRSITRSVLTDKKGTVWFCTDNGIYEYVPGKPFRHHLFSGNESRFSNSSKIVFSGVETGSGDIWFYGYCGIVRYSNGKFTQFTERNGLHPESVIISLSIDKDGSMLATDLYNLYKIENDTLLPISKQLGLVNFTSGAGGNLNMDNNGSAWISYNKQLFKIEKNRSGSYTITDSIIPPPSAPDLSEISTFGFDSENNCWIGYPGGKMKVYFAGNNGRYTHSNSITYTTDDGLAPVTEFNYRLMQNSKGDIVVVPQKTDSDKRFVFTIAGAKQRMKMPVPQVSLTGILINYKTPDWAGDGYVTGSRGFPVSPRLHHKNDNITFEYTGILLSNPDGIVYQVMLKGYDKEWRMTDRTLANYTNLSPGRYTFLVKAANVNGAWSNPVSYDFTILPPWYKKWWAMLLWIFAGIFIIAFIFFLRINAVRMQHLKESNHFKSGIIGLIGHDMMTPLRYIAKVASQLKTYDGRLSRKTTMDSLEEISATATQLHVFSQSIIHWIKIQSTEFSPVIEKFRISKIITEMVEFHHPLAAEKGNKITHEINGNLYCNQDPTLVRIILHNLLLNSNKFTSNGEIRISAGMENNWLVIRVHDNGKGMDEDKVNSLNRLHPILSSLGTQSEKGWGIGYKVIMDLLKFSKGTLHIKSRPDEGTEVKIKLPA